MRRIEVTPEEAKKKLCPRIQPFVSNQHTTYPTPTRCVATDCMHWAWSSVPAKDASLDVKTGYCSS